MTKKKSKDYVCNGCDIEFSVKTATKEPILYCPFCSEDVILSDANNPLLNSFDSLDDFNEEDFLEEDSSDEE